MCSATWRHGSPDPPTYAQTKRRPSRSINFVVAHDGFTLADLVSYEHKHNEANGEGNRDGTDENHSWNNGTEGPSGDVSVQAARLRDQRALLATLLLARGTPMLAMGSELGHSQGGNNNAYAQDNATTWIDWAAADTSLADFVGRLIALRKRHPALRADRFLTGAASDATLLADVVWCRADGKTMAPADWQDGNILTALLYADSDRVALVFNRGTAVAVTLPEPRDGHGWRIEADSSAGAAPVMLDDRDFTCPPRAVVAVAEIAVPVRKAGGTDPALLDRLATAAGIAPEWWDIDGTRHPVSPDTTRAILAAMHLPAATSGEARDSLAGFTASHQRRTLPHAAVVREGEAISLPCVLAPGTDAPSWLIIEDEDGSQRQIRLTPDGSGDLSCADGFAVRVAHQHLPTLPVGRWRVWREHQPEIACALTVAPRGCFLPDAFAGGGRRFGVAAHLYSVRRYGDQGIGDFSTLAELGRAAGSLGAASLGLNPLHMLFPDQRERASPYHPSDRRFIDPIFVDVGADGFGLDAPAARALLGTHACELAALSGGGRRRLSAGLGDQAGGAGSRVRGLPRAARHQRFRLVPHLWRRGADPLRDLPGHRRGASQPVLAALAGRAA